MEFYSVMKKWNVICSNMDRPRNCHTEWSKSDKDKYVLSLICQVLKKKTTGTNEHTYKTEIVSQI